MRVGEQWVLPPSLSAHLLSRAISFIPMASNTIYAISDIEFFKFLFVCSGFLLCRSFTFLCWCFLSLHSFYCCSVTQSCLTLCNPIDCSTPGFPVHQQLWELAQIHVYQVGDAIQPSHPLSSIVPFSSCLQSFPASGSFQMSQFFTSGGQSTGVSASASVLPMNIQDWLPSGWTGWISLQSKGLSRVLSNTTIKRTGSLAFSFLCGSTVTSIHD